MDMVPVDGMLGSSEESWSNQDEYVYLRVFHVYKKVLIPCRMSERQH